MNQPPNQSDFDKIPDMKMNWKEPKKPAIFFYGNDDPGELAGLVLLVKKKKN